MKNYKFMPHTADAKFQAWGRNLEEAFKSAAYAMTDIITEHELIESKIKRQIKIVSENPESLLYDFLEQMLILLDSDSFLLKEIKKLKIIEKKDRFLLMATLLGDNKPSKYQIKTTIKAVTYQEMFIKHEKGRVTLQIVVDV